MFVSSSSHFNALYLEKFDLYVFILFQVLISVSTFFLKIKVFSTFVVFKHHHEIEIHKHRFCLLPDKAFTQR